MNHLDYLLDVLVGERRLLGQLGVGGAAHDDTARLQLLAQLVAGHAPPAAPRLSRVAPVRLRPFLRVELKGGGDARKSTPYLRGVTAAPRSRRSRSGFRRRDARA